MCELHNSSISGSLVANSCLKVSDSNNSTEYYNEPKSKDFVVHLSLEWVSPYRDAPVGLHK